MKTQTSFLLGAGALCLLTTVVAKPAAHASRQAARPHVAAPAHDTAIQVVQQYLAARNSGQPDEAYRLLTAAQRRQLPPLGQREQMLRSLAATGAQVRHSPAMLPLLALFLDMRNTLHFRFHVLGGAPGDPRVVLVRTYQVGTPLSSIRVLKIVTVSDPEAGGALRLDPERTASVSDPSVIGAAQGRARQAVSQSNLKQISLGILQYVQDHNEHYPDAARWVDEVMPYIKSQAVFHDPAAPDPEKWNYALNRNLAGKSLAKVQSPASTVLLFESTAGVKNASDAGASVPMPGRHNGGTDYAFADGHVKWLRDGSKPSFTLDGAPSP